jgi:hypothetical protein
MLLRFRLYRDSPNDGPDEVYINPLEVISIVATSRRPAFGGWSDVAVIHLRGGRDYTVYDGARRVALEIQQAQLQATAVPEEEV